MPRFPFKRRRRGGGEGTPLAPAPPIASPPSEKRRPRLKKLRFLFVLLGLGMLAVTSMVFGMMAAVSQELPAIYDFARYKSSKNSELYDAYGEPLGTLTSDQNKILLTSDQISPNMKNAVVAIEDARYYEHNGVDFQGIGRALVKDVLSLSAAQGASTITQQFIKEALKAQGDRSLFVKFKEAALAYRLEHHWSKDKILTEYLNTVYFGEGAYGIEAAARTYFGAAHPGCGTATDPCAAVLEPWEAAMLAGVIQSPSAYDPKLFPENALWRRNLVLQRMSEHGFIAGEQLQEGKQHALPAPEEIQPPRFESKAPYFTAFMRQQLVERYGASKAFFGGLRVKSTLDLRLQEKAEEAVNSYLGYLPATASLVVIDNRNAGIRAMVGGPDFDEKPFNLATQGLRQPGSSIKPFTLITALEQGISPATTYESSEQIFHFGKKKKEIFQVTNDEDAYLGACSIECATTHSDNAIFAQLALEGLEGNSIHQRTASIARTAHRMGYSGKLSTNPAMVLGGLKVGVNPLDWTYAYSTLGNNGDRVSGTLAPTEGDSPVTYTKVTDHDGHTIKDGDNRVLHSQVVNESVALEAKRILETVVSSGTGRHAQIGLEGQWGKTGTTENNGDAWFCGGVSNEITACVWVGYADTTTPMTDLYHGEPVQGGTFPAEIWAAVIRAWKDLEDERAAEEKAKKAEREAAKEAREAEREAEENGETYEPPPTEFEFEGEPEYEEGVEEGGGAAGEEEAPAEEEPEPAPAEAPEEPAVEPTGPPEGGNGAGGGVTAG